MPNSQTYIKSIQLSGYKSVKNVSCDLDPGLNIIIGNNGSGKSNVLEFIDKILNREYTGLDLFSANIILENFTGSYFKDINDKPSLIEPLIWHSEGRISSQQNLEVESLDLIEPEKNLRLLVEFIRFNLPQEIGVLSKEYNPKYQFNEKRFLTDSNGSLVPVKLGFWLRSEFRDEFLNVTSSIEDLNDKNVYEWLNLSFKDFFEDVIAGIKHYTPVQNLRIANSIRIVQSEADILELRNIVLEYQLNNEWFGWDALSDGTKRLLYSFFAIYPIILKRNNTPFGESVSIILLEEPEIGIHPHQLHLFLNCLKKLSDPQQIILSTHSPQVLDILGADELSRIIIAEIDGQKGTSLRHLNDEEIEKAQMYLNDSGLLSDYWRFSDFQRSQKAR